MRIVEPYAKMLYIGTLPPDRAAGVEALRMVELFGRVSHRSEEKQTEDSWQRFIPAVVMQHGDWSITEHINVMVEALVDRGVSHEWVRHRIGQYTQESTRFVRYGDEINVVRPEGVVIDADGGTIYDSDWYSAIKTAELAYQSLLGRGIAPQIARSVLPTCLATKLIITYNLRNWRHFFLMRTTKEAHPQMREVAIPLLKEFQEKIPLLYDDIIPEQRQVDNLRLPR